MSSRARSSLSSGGRILAVFAITALFAGSSTAADIADLRVGDHADYTRVVLELDQATGYRLVVPQEGGPAEVVMQVNAAGKARQIATKSPLVREVTITPAERGSTVRIALSTASVQISEMILSQPPRIVLDVRPSGPVAQTAAASSGNGAPAVPSLREEAAENATATQLPAAMPPSTETTASTEPPTEPTLVVEEVDLAVAAVESPGTEQGDAMADGVQAAEMASDRPEPVAVAPPAPPMTKTAKRAPAAQSEGDSFLSTPTMVGLGVFAVVMTGWMIMRRRNTEDEDPLFPVISADDVDGDYATASEEGVVPEAVDVSEDGAMATEPIPVTASNGPADSVVPVESGQMAFGEASNSASVDVPEEEPEAVATNAGDSLFDAVAAVEAQVAEPVPTAVEEGLNKRIIDLESRLESLTESRERLERQVAAQTEELRVQRAAIARTQRVVRSLSKGEDEANEPVPRPPN